MKSARPYVGALVCALVFSASSAQARVSPRDIYVQKGPAVVLIVASQEGSSSASAGTGSIVREDGTIVTNCHVIYDEQTKKPFPVVHVFLKPDRVTGNMDKDLSRHYTAKVVAFDRELDLAMLRMENPPKNLAVITLGNPEEVGPGDETIAIGHPEQGGLWTITTGVIGAEFENFKGIPGKDVFQMETSLNRGNSGGPLFDVRGYQVGVNTAIARQGEGGIAITGVNFALKASVVQKWMAKYNVALAYGSEKIGGTQVAMAEPEKPAQPSKPAEPPKPAEPVKQPDTRAADSTPPTKIDSPQGGIKVEEGYGEVNDEDEDATEVAKPVTPKTGDAKPADVKRPVQEKVNKQKKPKPQRFAEHYRTKPRPYSFKKLFTAVDKVRANAQEAFDDLEREERKRGR